MRLKSSCTGVPRSSSWARGGGTIKDGPGRHGLSRPEADIRGHQTLSKSVAGVGQGSDMGRRRLCETAPGESGPGRRTPPGGGVPTLYMTTPRTEVRCDPITLPGGQDRDGLMPAETTAGTPACTPGVRLGPGHRRPGRDRQSAAQERRDGSLRPGFAGVPAPDNTPEKIQALTRTPI